MNKWLKFLSIIAILALPPALLFFVATLFLKIAIFTVCVGLIILLAVLQILGKITLHKMLWWIVSIIAIMIIVIWSPWNKDWTRISAVSGPMADTGMQTVQPVEEWVFEWSTSPNESRTFEAKIDKVDSESLWFSTPYMCGGRMRIATYMLAKSGDSFAGSWSQKSPKDSGTLFLKKDGVKRYVGQITDAEKRTAVITLKRK